MDLGLLIAEDACINPYLAKNILLLDNIYGKNYHNIKKHSFKEALA
jgi:hypothetical protein